jgi:S-DNA-T family DNA segregation ATPase FtsK/SpoIIIE
MAGSTNRGWQIDWAGPHGTAWGTVNAVLTVLSCASLGRFIQTHWPLPATRMLLGVAVVTVLGVVFVLLRAAVRSKRTPAATILYKIACWVGTGVWLAHMYLADHWSFKWWLTQIGVLVALAVVAGLLAGLAADDAPQSVQSSPGLRPQPAGQQAGGLTQGQRDAMAAEWEERLVRLSNGDLDGVKVPNIEEWARGDGFTVQSVCPPGGSTWKAVASLVEAIGGDLDLTIGCRVSVKMGKSRKVALIDVMTVNQLAEEQPYPGDYGPLSILDPLPGAVTDDGSEIGPDLRSKCMLLVGETGSGKTNAGNVVGTGVIRCTDALRWDVDFTGGLFLDMLEPFMRGRTSQPAVDWAAWDEGEALWMTRAALRGHRARKAGYRDLMRQANDDKIPISDAVPAFIIFGDEIRRITGAPSDFIEIKNNLIDIINEGRSAGFRTVLLGLRATADVVDTGIQSQCHVIAVTRAKNDSEYAWAFGWHSGACVEDAPYPGCGFISLESGARPVAEKWRRLKPQQLMEVAVATDGRHPEVDELTRLALNGRNSDGTPMSDLFPNELDCYDTRWDRFRDHFGGDHPSRPAPPQPAGGPSVAGGSGQGGAVSLTQAVADLDGAMNTLAERVAEVQRQGGDAAPDLQAEFAAILEAEGFGPDVNWSDPDSWPTDWDSIPDSEPQPDDEAKLLKLIHDAGPDGTKPSKLLAALYEQHKIKIHRDTLHERLRTLKDRGAVHQPQHGKWAFGPDPR